MHSLSLKTKVGSFFLGTGLFCAPRREAMAASLSSLLSACCYVHGDDSCSNRAPTKSFIRHNPDAGKNRIRHTKTLGMSVVVAATEGSKKSKGNVPAWARPGSEEPPPWARNEGGDSNSKEGFEIPFYVYLLASTVTAIAAIGSVFEYANKKPVFGVLSSDSIFYAPLLGFFAFTGIPTSAYLWVKSVQAANKEAEEQDKRDGYF